MLLKDIGLVPVPQYVMSSIEQTERSALISSKHSQCDSTHESSKVKQLTKNLGCSDVFIYVVSNIIGAGIYVSPGLVARYTNNMGTSLILWTISGIVCLFGALCFCELAVALRKTGNQYILIKEIYGNFAGFCTIWAQTLIISPTDTAVISFTISEHIVGLFADMSSEEGQWLARVVALSSVFLLIVINCLSSSFAAKAQTLFGVVQILGVALFISIGIWKVSTGATQNFKTMFDSNRNETVDFSSLSLAFVSALWSYDGWGDSVSLNEELYDLNRNLRLGIITGMPFVIVCFLLFNLAFMSMLTHAEMGRSITVATAFIEKSIGARYAVIVPIVVALSCFGSLNATIFSASRSLLSAAREGHLPLPLSYIHRERLTPVPALLFLFALSALWILTFGSQLVYLLTYYSVAIWVTYGAALFGVIVLRIRRPDLQRPDKVWLIYPILTTIVSCYIIVAPFLKRPIQCVICLVILLTAIPVYYLIVYCVPESMKNYKGRFYSWILDHFPLVECVFEVKSCENGPEIEEIQC